MSKKILLIDNYDSFTYNVVELLRNLNAGEISVVRNDKVDLSTVESFDKVIFSPGPGLPSEAGLMPKIIKDFSGKVPMLGICLGHQCVGEVFGASLRNLAAVVHGRATPIKITVQSPLFEGIPLELKVGRYHSWVVAKESLPGDLEILAEDAVGEIMALSHKSLPVYGVQFHPESVLTEHGEKILKNFIEHV